MTRTELANEADAFRMLAAKAEGGMRTVYLRLARDYYNEAGLTGMARWCERHMD